MSEKKMLCVSTGNMTPDDNELLRLKAAQLNTPDGDGGYPLVVLGTPSGWVVSTWHDLKDPMWTDEGLTICQALEHFGHSFGFISVIRHAITTGCRWCEFDADAPELEGFEVYHWP